MPEYKDVKSCDSSSKATLDEHQWFHGMLPREDIDRLLTEDGQFLVRVTEPRPDMITLDQLIGKGAFGEVYSGTLTLGINTVRVAVKVHKGGTVNKEVIAEICKEARFMRHYRHPNVIKFYGVAVERDPLMLVMELVTGGALDSLLRKKKDEFSLQDLLYFAYTASKGLEYLHDNACIHRDVAARFSCFFCDLELSIHSFPISLFHYSPS
ncbi:unnamed protein product [Angiostrongylus costaricensis]|uniref:Protein kinase domain-containing protein n=1 Tax=Angiostrongylus costaricensis TaxID=334426 RepID=A0A0R3PPG6_ANGCS|nr:unnamed protein product [Angiostrongylus costaricensis]